MPRTSDFASDHRAVVDSLGDPERALSQAMLFDKARRLMQDGPVHIDEILQAATDLLDRCTRGEDMHLPFPQALLKPLHSAS